VFFGAPLNNGALPLNATPVVEPAGRRRGARPREPREAANVLIRIWIRRTYPLAGTAATEQSGPLHFDGWLELLWVISQLVAGNAEASDQPTKGNETGIRHGHADTCREQIDGVTGD
jgi:hypothetical protein